MVRADVRACVIGVDGLVRDTVARRSREVGIRIALEADAAGGARVD